MMTSTRNIQVVVPLLWMVASLRTEAFMFLQRSTGTTNPTHHRPTTAFVPAARRRIISSTQLWDGTGVATNYTWTETAYEFEIAFKVPTGTRSRDVSFKCKPKTLDLKLKYPNGTTMKVLLDGERRVRGKIGMDGTFWGLSDDADGTAKDRTLTVFVEKRHRQVSNEYEDIEYDWGGLYPDDEDEVIKREYQEAEPFDVRDYAARMGVDIDNINMSWVDKDMFSLRNMTKNSLDKMVKQGFLKEVTKQADGTEWVDDDGKAKPHNTFGPNIGQDEIQEAEKRDKESVPFVDTDTPWGKTVPVERTEDGDIKLPEHAKKQIQDYTKQKIKEKKEEDKKKTKRTKRQPGQDVIDVLTVKRLKAILKKEGLKVSGKKEELQTRLREHVRSLAKKGAAAKREESLQD